MIISKHVNNIVRYAHISHFKFYSTTIINIGNNKNFIMIFFSRDEHKTKFNNC